VLHDFVRELDAILFKFSGKHIKRSNAPEQFVQGILKHIGVIGSRNLCARAS
jgi:hypothetical protein